MALGSSFLRHPSLALSVALLSLGPVAPALAQAATRLADINTAGGTLDSSPRQFVRMGAHVFFLAYDSQHSVALYKSDGTASGTTFVADVIPGPGPFDPFQSYSDPQWLVATSSRVFFRAWTPTHGTELWASDGTPQGTRLVKDIVPGPTGSVPQHLAAVGERVFFAATDPEHGPEPWVSDGTDAGTRLVANLGEGATGSWPQPFVGAGDRAFFAARDAQGSALWVTDGTSTTRVKDVAGWWNPYSDQFASMGGNVYFILNSVELWVSRGTAETTFQLAVIEGYVSGLVAAEDVVYFSSGYGGLWRTDGTVAGTRPIKPGVLGLYGRTVGSTLYFQHAGQLWKSDGTEPGTVEVRSLRGDIDVPYGVPVAAVGGGMYASATRYRTSSPWGVEATELWWTDGTAERTSKVFTFPPEAGIGGAALGDTLVFSARDAEKGHELWATSVQGGVPGATQLLRDIRTEVPGSFPAEAVTVGTQRYFRACDTTRGCELWRTDGTAGGTALVKDIWPGPQGSYPQNLTPMNGRLYFTANDGTVGIELWASDGTEAGTVLVMNIFEGGSGIGSQPLYLTVVGSTLFFSAVDQEGNDLYDPTKRHGRELWKSDGTAVGTVLVRDIYAGPNQSSNPYALTAFAGRLFFSAHDPLSGGAGLWASDGTAAGTLRLDDPAHGSFPASDLVEMDGALYFIGAGKLWRTDGTTAGTMQVAEAAGVAGLAAGRGILFFTAWDPDHGRELWASDGTAAGTRRVTDLHPGAFPESAYSSEAGFLDTRTLVVAGRRAYFTAYDAETGWELWTSDGTVTGTRVVKDICEGGDSYPYHLTTALERVFFTAYDPANGRELWTSDGTDAGTRLVAQIAPGAASSAPDALHFSGASLLFGADDGVAGREPWLVEVGPLTIRDLIERIEDLLDRGELSRGRAYSLIAKLQLALWFLQYPNGEGMAAVMLDLFVWELEYDVRIGVLSAEEGAPLAEAARQVLADLRAR